MLIRGRPLGIVLLALWCAAHTIPLSLLALDASGAKAFLAWVLVIGALLVAIGIFIGWRIARYLAVLQVGLHVFVFAVAGWAFLFVALAWGLHASEAPVVGFILSYLLFTFWAFMYLFYPDVADYFEQRQGFAAASQEAA